MAEPDLRILQANERTLLAWVRTGLALIAFGFVLARIVLWLRLEHPERTHGVSSYLGIASLVLGVACTAIGSVRFVRARRAILAGESIHPSPMGPVLVAAGIGAMGIAAIVYLLIES